MTTIPAPVFERSEDDRVIAGVCGGLASALGVDATLVRLVFALLALAGGAGIVLYFALWVQSEHRRSAAPLSASLRRPCWRCWSPSASRARPARRCPDPRGRRRRRRARSVRAPRWLAAAAGDRADHGRRRDPARPTSAPPARSSRPARSPELCSCCSARGSGSSPASAPSGSGSTERAEVAARVHDSVLQTLALIQRHADDPVRVAAIARRQERELRRLALRHRRRRGDDARRRARRRRRGHRGTARRAHRARERRRRAARRALRALVARRARGDDERREVLGLRRDLRLRRGRTTTPSSVFVRDRGAGFDRAAVPDDRRGIAESIEGRIGTRRRHRHDHVCVRVDGTEVELTLPGGRREAARRPRRRPRALPRRRARRAGRRGRDRRRGRLRRRRGAADPRARPGRRPARRPPARTAAARRSSPASRPSVPGVKFLALSVSDAAEDVIGVIRAGARGYVTKTISRDELADAIERVAEGDAVFSPRLAGFVLDAFRAGEPRRRATRARDAHRARTRGAAADRARLPLQGDRGAAPPVREDGRGARVERAAQAPAVVAARADALGARPPPDLGESRRG